MAFYKHILVTLDGSVIAESALSPALDLAKLADAEVTLLEVVPPLDQVVERGAHPILINEHWEPRKRRAQRYLQGIADQKDCRGVRVHVAVETGPVAEAILDYSRRHGVDLVVMATHGLSGFKRWLLGSVAQKVIQGTDRPILLVRPRPGPPI